MVKGERKIVGAKNLIPGKLLTKFKMFRVRFLNSWTHAFSLFWKMEGVPYVRRNHYNNGTVFIGNHTRFALDLLDFINFKLEEVA